MTQKTAKDAMTPISEIFSLDINSKLDEYAMLLSLFSVWWLYQIKSQFNFIIYIPRQTMGLILSEGHSRVPIYSIIPTSIIGFILVSTNFNFYIHVKLEFILCSFAMTYFFVIGKRFDQVPLRRWNPN